MADEFIPTTEDVRLIWIVSQTGCTARAEFERWLNEVKAGAWTNGYERGYDDGDDKRDYDPTQHPYIEKDEV